MKTSRRPIAVPVVEFAVLGAMVTLGLFGIATGRVGLVCPAIAMLVVMWLHRRVKPA
jgi:hypothetical protein